MLKKKCVMLYIKPVALGKFKSLMLLVSEKFN